jgi:tRNA pseudouridine38-40 synthase
MRYCGVLSYCGKAYKGFERQKDYPTIQGKVEAALSYLSGTSVAIHGAGRTDAGVHAKGQTFSFDFDPIPDLGAFVHALNRLLPGDILVLSLRQVDSTFDARHSSSGKVYSYAFHYGQRDPLALQEFQLEWPNFSFPLFIACMKLYEGTHNFMDFTPKSEDKDHFIRTIEPIRFAYDEKGGHMKVTLTGNGFMTYMVRILVGVAFKVAMGKMSLDEVKRALDPTERKIISYKAPAEGLCLEEVLYGSAV